MCGVYKQQSSISFNTYLKNFYTKSEMFRERLQSGTFNFDQTGNLFTTNENNTEHINLTRTVEILKSPINITEYNFTNNLPCDQRQYFIFNCQKDQLCGGLGDREKGIITSFLLALLSNRTLIIDMADPCPMEDYQTPNVYDWLSCKDYALSRPKSEVHDLAAIDKKPGKLKTFKVMDFAKEWTKKVVRYRINWLVIDAVKDRMQNSDMPSFGWAKNLTKEEIIKAVMFVLFKPGPTMSNDIQNFFDTYIQNKTLVCAHVRIGKNPSNPLDGSKSQRTPNATKIIDFLKQYNNVRNYTIFVATDSDEVRAACYSELVNFVTLNKPIVHVDRYGGMGKNKSCDGLYNAILEQRLLSLCDVLLLTQSNFGGIASYIRGRGVLYIYNSWQHFIEKLELEQMATKYKLARR